MACVTPRPTPDPGRRRGGEAYRGDCARRRLHASRPRRRQGQAGGRPRSGPRVTGWRRQGDPSRPGSRPGRPGSGTPRRAGRLRWPCRRSARSLPAPRSRPRRRGRRTCPPRVRRARPGGAGSSDRVATIPTTCAAIHIAMASPAMIATYIGRAPIPPKTTGGTTTKANRAKRLPRTSGSGVRPRRNRTTRSVARPAMATIPRRISCDIGIGDDLSRGRTFGDASHGHPPCLQ